MILDHFTVVAEFHQTIVRLSVPQTIKYQKWKVINIEAFKNWLKKFWIDRYPKTNTIGLPQQYNSVLRTLINLHAPLVTKKISPKPPNPWMTPYILVSKRHCWYLECVWHRNLTTLNRLRRCRQTHLFNRPISKVKSAHYSKIIADHSGDHSSYGKH